MQGGAARASAVQHCLLRCPSCFCLSLLLCSLQTPPLPTNMLTPYIDIPWPCVLALVADPPWRFQVVQIRLQLMSVADPPAFRSRVVHVFDCLVAADIVHESP